MDSLPLVLASLPFVLRQLSHRNRPPSEQQSSGKSNNKGQNRMVHWWNFGVVIFLCDLLYGQWWCHAVIYLQQEMNFNKGLNQLHVCYRLCLVQLDFFFYGGIHFDPELPGFGKHKKLPFSSKVHHVNYEGDREQIEQLKGFHKDTTHPHLLCLYHTTVSPPTSSSHHSSKEWETFYVTYSFLSHCCSPHCAQFGSSFVSSHYFAASFSFLHQFWPLLFLKFQLSQWSPTLWTLLRHLLHQGQGVRLVLEVQGVQGFQGCQVHHLCLEDQDFPKVQRTEAIQCKLVFLKQFLTA